MFLPWSSRSLAASLAAALTLALPARAVILDATGDPTANTTAPSGALLNSGWQYEGQWIGFLGTAIAPQYFITAEHIGGSVGDIFRLGGVDYVTDERIDDPQTDLRIWHVTQPMPAGLLAPLYTKPNETGKPLVVFGRGTQRGAEVRDVANNLHGWLWGAGDGVQRWGTNTVASVVAGGTGVGSLLSATFDHSTDPLSTEAHLSVGDSGGAVFIQDGTVWKLAGINYGVSGPYYTAPPADPGFNAALFDENGYFVGQTAATSTPASGPGEFFVTRVSSRAAFINSVIPEPGSGALLLSAAALLLRRRRDRSAR